MSHRLSVRLPDGLGWGLEATARRLGKTKSEVVRDALIRADVRVPGSVEIRREALRRAAELAAQQSEMVDAAALIRESREELEQRDRFAIPPGERPPCSGRREPSRGRATPGFQRVPLV